MDLANAAHDLVDTCGSSFLLEDVKGHYVKGVLVSQHLQCQYKGNTFVIYSPLPLLIIKTFPFHFMYTKVRSEPHRVLREFCASHSLLLSAISSQ